MARQGINTGSAPDAGDGDSLLIGALKINANFSEIYTTLGDGNNITNSIGFASTSGISTYSNLSRVVIKDSGSTVGTAGTIDFGNNLTVSAISAGIVTVTATSSSDSQWQSTTAGIHTLSNVGIGTTNPTSALTVQGDISVSGIATINGITVQSPGSENIYIGDSAGLLRGSGDSSNVAIGYQAARNSDGMDRNVTIGARAGENVQSNWNTIVGYEAGKSNSGAPLSGAHNTLIGYQAGLLIQGSSFQNTFVGSGAGDEISSGDSNTILGRFNGNQNGLDIRTSSNNVVLSDGDGNIRFYVNPSGNVGIGTTNPGEKLQVDGNIRVGISITSNYIFFKGIYKDGNPNFGVGEESFLPYEHTYIGERIYDYSGIGERSELLIFKGNDIADIYGPDRIRLLSSEHRFDVLGFTTSGTFEQVGVSTAAINAVTINTIGVGIGITNPTSALTVVGSGTSTSQLYVSGVSTFFGNVTFKGSVFGDTIITDGSIYSPTGFTTFAISVARGVDFIDQGGLGKVRISGDQGVGNGRIGFYNLNNLVSTWDTNLINGSIDIYNYTNSGTQNITISAGSSVVLQHGGTNTKLQTLGVGVTVTGTTFTNQLSVSGVSTCTGSVRVGVDTSAGVILTSPNGTKYQLFVEDDGTLKTVAV